ncbi:hypothetical protein TELCIR_24756 [Teladorsagia circumcincta]|uniref:Uncharacterized protein n=1 Tax=Teladorsagia circumcincta TaxID=45464 RepID=A0A2G9T7G9_TELCI|nr:hypothetical protein TELCIR_24756 [Teladorsagia circumcincta]
MEGVPPLSWIAHPVRVQLVSGGSDQSVDGNLYTVDPATGSLVLVRFRNEMILLTRSKGNQTSSVKRAILSILFQSPAKYLGYLAKVIPQLV